MFIIWYALLGFVNLILLLVNFFIVKLLRLDTSILLILKNKLNKSSINYSNNTINQNISNIFFKDLYDEYNFFKNNNKSILNQIILNNTINSKLIGNYDYYLNFLIFSKVNLKKSFKTNLNYINNALLLPKIDVNFKNYLKSYKFTKVTGVLNIKNEFINISNNLEKKINNSWIIKYSPSNFIKYINSTNLSKYTILFLRKNKVFNKGRYSRNRQYYRTGVYWCLYINIIAVVGIHFWFYKLTMNFGYMWWLLFVFILSFIAPKAIKYRLYNPLILYNTYVLNFVWLSLLLSNILNYLKNFLNKIKNYLLHTNINIFNNVNSNIFSNFYILVLSLSNNLNFLNNSKIYSYEYNYINYYYNNSNSIIIFDKIKTFFLKIAHFSLNFK